ncbi:hypothetical protein Pmani_022656 [Petrolisthes manimaculis]|uniref:Uncharacterized protein n=1 Tax=Petrolisthes manimaculis TaxID=1843537 RepID=A0AAE1U0H7_9EUCA|nr:hypothetical protein Pmani_022656 [Petrolisthes manimaculis]
MDGCRRKKRQSTARGEKKEAWEERRMNPGGLRETEWKDKRRGTNEDLKGRKEIIKEEMTENLRMELMKIPNVCRF